MTPAPKYAAPQTPAAAPVARPLKPLFSPASPAEVDRDRGRDEVLDALTERIQDYAPAGHDDWAACRRLAERRLYGPS